MYWDRFDICEAWYLALVECHGGQFSPEYAKLCKLRQYFDPAPNLCVESLSENALAIYDDAVMEIMEK